MERKVHIGVSIPEGLLKKLRYVANHESRSMSGLVRVLIRRHIEEFEKENGGIFI